jgi:hypothetical protein
MGIFNSIKNRFLGHSDPEGHFFADQGTQRATTDEAARQIASLLQSPNIKLRDDGDEIHVTGVYRGRAARVVLNVTFGQARSELKLLSQEPASFRIAYDVTPAETYAASRRNRDQWDDDGGDELKQYVSRHACYAGDPDELAAGRQIWSSFAPELQTAVIAMAEAWKGSLSLSSGVVSIDPFEGVLGRRDAAQVVHTHLELAACTAETIEYRMSRLG